MINVWLNYLPSIRKKTVAAKATAKSASKATKVWSKHRIFLASRDAEARWKELHWLAEIFSMISKYENKIVDFNDFLHLLAQ
jgi:hypothetical protein